MDAIKRQASKFREQVTKQQQALLRHLGNSDGEAFVGDDAEISRRHQLQNLYISTRAAKHFEKDIVHGLEGSISVTSKEINIDKRIAQDCSKYEADNHCSTSTLTETAIHVRESHQLIIKEKEILLGVYDEKVCNPLRELIKSAELVDGRRLIRQYEKLWQEVEAQAAEVLRLKSKMTDGPISDDKSIKLQVAEDKLDELKSRLMSLGKEASSAMLSVEAQQQRMTFQKLVLMVNAEISFHRNILTILDKLRAEMNELEEQNTSSPPSVAKQSQSHFLETGLANLNGKMEPDVDASFVAKVVHPFDGQAEGELSLSVNDIVIVHQVFPVGWAKGECNGKTGWFPSPYVQKLDSVSTGNITPTSQ
ncbi:SH3 domain-containing protein 1-like [Silene latifolia]|uniref:SH3 domain-containing protein 1-like n=1 Tax=Silene latifolia TaxID=37657 RepID=UPI003D7843D4